MHSCCDVKWNFYICGYEYAYGETQPLLTVHQQTHLVERRAQLDKWHGLKQSLSIHLNGSSVKTVQVAHNDQQIGRRLHRQEPATRHIHA